MVGHRNPVDLVPERLKTFRRSDWERDDDTNHFDAFRAWKAARQEWIAAHPDSLALGSAAERFRTEFQTQMAQYDRKAQSWSDYERGGPSFAWDDPSNERYAVPPLALRGSTLPAIRDPRSNPESSASGE